MADQDPQSLAAHEQLQQPLPPDLFSLHAEPPHESSPQRRFGGSRAGRLMWRSRTRTAGIRFEWAQRSSGPVLRVVATWTDRDGQPHHTSYSVQNNGLEGALDRAIASRTSCGAPQPDRQDLLQRLRQEFETSPFAHAQQAPQGQPS
ncbi:hypothetical protein [Roseateles asaccharophilus]|uniref:Uncharacterized protein n=1 Tax=Roseateles asaccharophilus TaxID=582607 RepID=A0ABU2A247_9BURK|nr:hypothetical protein [Roseateles asaccharophilus]MDR7331266.1 hypothetical protein [Roseateles asaccharophilus]